MAVEKVAIEKTVKSHKCLKNKLLALKKDVEQVSWNQNDLTEILKVIGELDQTYVDNAMKTTNINEIKAEMAENATTTLLLKQVLIGFGEVLLMINKVYLMYEDQLNQVNVLNSMFHQAENDAEMSQNGESAIMALIKEISDNQFIITGMEKKLSTKIKAQKEQLNALSTRVKQFAKNVAINQNAEEVVQSGHDNEGLEPEELVSPK